jgi:hypothetical protein
MPNQQQLRICLLSAFRFVSRSFLLCTDILYFFTELLHLMRSKRRFVTQHIQMM